MRRDDLAPLWAPGRFFTRRTARRTFPRGYLELRHQIAVTISALLPESAYGEADATASASVRSGRVAPSVPTAPNQTIEAPGALDLLSRILYSRAMAKTVPLSEARARLSELMDELESRHEHVVITRKGRPVAVLVPSSEYDAMEETLEILHDEELLAALRESEKDVKAGRLHSLDDVKRELGLA